MARTLVAAVVPAVAIAAAWLTTEQPPGAAAAALVVAVAVSTALPRRPWQRMTALVVAALAVLGAIAGIRPWESMRPRVLSEPVAELLRIGIGDFYGVVLPFDPTRHPEMHALVLLAIFGFSTAVAQLVAARMPLAGSAVTITAVGWPATLTDTRPVLLGTFALVAVLVLFASLRAGSVRAVVPSVVLAALVVSGAAWASSAVSLSQTPALDWRTWDFRGVPASAFGVQFVWDANYDGITFPPTKTVVLEIEGPDRAQYWRVSTLDRFTADRWIEEQYPQLIGPAEGPVPQEVLMPRRARSPDNWLEQTVKVKALVDDRVTAAGTPVALSAKSLGTVFYLTGGVVRARRMLPAGTRYRVWSYVPDPAPTALARAPASYPRAANRFLTVWGRQLPPYGSPGREARVEAYLGDGRFGIAEYRPLYAEARRVTASADTPYEAVLALESWFRAGGGFRYEERPSYVTGRPALVEFVTRAREGYCQHYAGAMAVMLRLLGVPARVAVGFTSGQRDGSTWRVTDHEAHAWVEVWFPGHGWVAFDPTPGRGTFSGVYSFATENAQALAALGRGDLDAAEEVSGRGLTQRRSGEAAAAVEDGGTPTTILVLLVLLAVVLAVGALKWSLQRARYLARDPRAVASATRRELESYLRDQRVEVPAGATLDELGRIVAAEIGVDGRAYVEAAGLARFGRPERAARDAVAARREARALVAGMRRRLSPWQRLRGFLSIRSLVGGRAA